MAEQYTYSYPRPMVTVDIVVLRVAGDGLETLLVKRGREPFEGRWVFPGGFMEIGERLADAAEARWFPASAMPDLAFDHKHVLETALEWLSARLGINTEEPPCFLAMTSEEQSALRRWLAETA